MNERADTDEIYLKPTPVLDCDHPDVISFAERTVDGASEPRDKAKKLFYAVRDGIVYDPRTPFFLPEHYRASEVLKRGRGYCVPKACLLAAAGRAVRIPSRLGLADIRNHGASRQIVEMMGCNIFTFHGYTEFLLHGRWVKATAAFDMPVFRRHNIAPVEFDGISDAVYPSHNLDGEPYVEYLTSHGSFADLPLEMLLESWKKHYGEHRVRLWMDAFRSMQLVADGEPVEV